MDVNMGLKIKELDQFKNKLSEFKEMSQLYEQEFDEFKEELDESRTKHFNLYKAGLDELNGELGES